MKKLELTAEQKEALEMRHKKSCGKRESDRIKAVLLRNENWATPMIAQAQRLHETRKLTLPPMIITSNNERLIIAF